MPSDHDQKNDRRKQKQKEYSKRRRDMTREENKNVKDLYEQNSMKIKLLEMEVENLTSILKQKKRKTGSASSSNQLFQTYLPKRPSFYGDAF